MMRALPMRTTSRLQDGLARAERSQQIVRIHRNRIEPWHFDAYVRATSRALVLIQPVRDRLDFDGFEVLRLKDITKVEPAPNADFLARAVRRPRGSGNQTTRLNLESLAPLLQCLSERKSLVVIHRELVAPTVCEVGAVVRVERASYALLEVAPDAEVESEPRVYPQKDVTRVQLDTAYQKTLEKFASPVLWDRVRQFRRVA